ncbi:MAG: carbamoyl phosphate synthase small subunit [Rhodospirillales bacterium 12-54-5]|nr:MAG: carbamoyl phosphate synthase small subunit [Rhodospirillales bacterium 12-54-5]
MFSGYGVGKPGATAGELCFNTAMTGYQEVLTDPSYMGQIITFTFPHIGNVGVNHEDVESTKGMGACGLILREAITEASNFRAASHLDDWLEARVITGISGVDTRALTRHVRSHGAQNAAIVFSREAAPSHDTLLAKAREALAAAPDMHGLELAAHATTQANHDWHETRWALGQGYATLRGDEQHLPLVVAIDYGVKSNILRSLSSQGCRITVMPATASAEDVLALQPDGVFLSNGPGDPSATGHYAVPVIKKLVDSGLPLFGICLGHQMLGIALGARTEKMKQGHRGANHPVKELATGKVQITSQNHGFCISDQGLPGNIEVTHRSLFDGTIQGIAVKDRPIFSVQGHPEASPGPHDSQYLFARFVEMIASQKKRAA